MSATLTSGINSLTLTVANPDRDDLIGIMVWCDTTDEFTPNGGNLVYFGAGLTYDIISLTEGVTHYVRYALISEIDPTDYDLSPQYSGVPDMAPDGVRYAVEIESTNGDVFRVGQGLTTYLIAHVFRNGIEVTDQIPDSQFKWRRVSFYPQGAPLDDATWNAAYASGYKQIMVTASSVEARATFHCDITT